MKLNEKPKRVLSEAELRELLERFAGCEVDRMQNDH